MKLKPCLLLAISTCLVALLEAGIITPSIGVVRYGDGSVRRVYGLEANVLVGEPVLPFADAVSFSDCCGLVSVNGHIELISSNGAILGEYDARDPRPVLNIGRELTTAIAYLPSRHALLHWKGRAFSVTEADLAPISGTVTSVEAVAEHSAILILTTPDANVMEARLSLDTGEPISVRPMPGVQGPAFLHQSFVLFHDKEGLEIESSNGNRRTIPVSARDISFEHMSSDWLHLSSASTKQDWALHVTDTGWQLSELPARPPANTNHFPSAPSGTHNASPRRSFSE